MTQNEIVQAEETLDPDDWEALRALGHQMVDGMLDSLRDIRQQPVWKPLGEELKEAFRAPLPRQGIGAEPDLRRSMWKLYSTARWAISTRASGAG